MKAYMSSKVKNIFGKEYELASMERILGGGRRIELLIRKATMDDVISEMSNQ